MAGGRPKDSGRFKPLSGIRSSAIHCRSSRQTRFSCFKPLSGIRSSAIFLFHRAQVVSERVSNPCREFVPLQSFNGENYELKIIRFKPLSGIRSSAITQARDEAFEITYRFKPLSGIRSSAIRSLARRRWTRFTFQTPVGNSFLCNHVFGATRSVPSTTVSNPCREFVPLQSTSAVQTLDARTAFQTPVGNSFLCNTATVSFWVSCSQVSNPCREFVPLQFEVLQGDEAKDINVSNPCREFVPLQLADEESAASPLQRFQTPVGNSFLCNTYDKGNAGSYHTPFQTPVGNSFLCNKKLAVSGFAALVVSNPCREFVPLQCWANLRVRFNLVGFKPLSGIRSSAILGYNLRLGSLHRWFQTPVGNSFLCN